jgi:hypothetical protein
LVCSAAGIVDRIAKRPAFRACGSRLERIGRQPILNPMKKNIWRAVIEITFIVFLFYSNLLMGEFERSGMGRRNGIAWAIGDVLTTANFEIAMIAALLGYIFFEFLRKKF